MPDKPNVFNIPANYHFLKSLLNWLDKNQLLEAKIFLPNRRSCREFRSLFLSEKNDAILPEIKAISDISYEDFFDFLPDEDAKKIIDEVLQIKVLSQIDYLFFLSKEIQKLSLFGNGLEFDLAFKIATNLQSLFDDIEREEIDLKKLNEIDDSDLSQHRQLTLDFLKSFHIQVKNSLLKENIFFEASSQNFIIQKFTQLLETQGSKTKIVIAGSTGSVAFSKKLIGAIAQKNHVILQGLNDEKHEIENHPQFFLNRLIDFLKIEKNSVQEITNQNFILSDEVRQNLISLMMLPSEETIKWQEIAKHLDVKKAALDLKKNFRLIEAKNEIEEAKIISLILLETVNEKQTAAIITDNDRLASLVKLELKRLSLPFHDSRNLSIFNSQLVNFLLLILELIESDFNSHSLLALLKNPLCQYSQDRQFLANFEIKILRQDRVNSGLDGIIEKLKNEKNLRDFFTELCEQFCELGNNLAAQASSLIKIAENLSKRTWLELLAVETAQIEIFEFFEKLKLKSEVRINPKNILRTFKILFTQISYFEKSNSTAPIQLLSKLEARLLNHDLVIIASLNEGDFPEIAGENWLGKKIKKDLGIDKTLKKIGQSANDFCNYLSNESLVMTRCRSRDGAVLIESVFLLKFKTICQKIGVQLNRGEKYFSLLREINNLEARKIATPNPKPKIEFRPKEISITDISKLISNPYEIYGKKILQLRSLEKIDFEPSYAEFGSFVHQALEEFIKTIEQHHAEANEKDSKPAIKAQNQENFLEKSRQIFGKYFSSAEAKLIWWPKFEKIFSDFTKKNEQFLGLKNYVEVATKLKIGGVLVSGKIDRIVINENGFAEIFDYKTGQVPTKKDVTSGLNPQLTIAALMMLESMIEISGLSYWKLSSSSPGEITKICTKNEEIKTLLAAAKSGLERLFEYFSTEENGYTATKNNQKSEYRQLSRIGF